MKAGQILSVIMPDAAAEPDHRAMYQAAFARLCVEGSPMPLDDVSEVIRRELGRPMTELFAEFDPRPLAAASIGQVHRARLPDGRTVAVKVQYPGVSEAIDADLKNTELLATFLQLLCTMLPSVCRLDLVAMAREISDRIREELDYRIEVSHQLQFADAYRGHPFIRIPEVVPELSTRRVLTMQFIDGLSYAEASAARRPLRDLWGEVIFRFGQDSLYRRALINTDTHPGNFLFHLDGTVTFLDFGCVKRMPTELIAITTGFLDRLVARDAEELHRWGITSGWVSTPHPPTPQELLQWWNDGWRYLSAPQPYTFSPHYVTNVIAGRISPSNTNSMVHRKLVIPSELTLAIRWDTGISAALAGLRATAPWNAIREEHAHGAPPATTLGEQHAKYLQHDRARR